MRVLWVAAWGDIGGGNRSLIASVSALRAHGVESTVLLPFKGNMVDELERRSICYRLLSLTQPDRGKPFRTLRAGVQLVSTFMRIRPHIVHANDIVVWRQIGLWCRVLRVPGIAHVRLFYDDACIRWCILGWLKPRCVICPSFAVKDHVEKAIARYAPAPFDIEVIYNPIELPSGKYHDDTGFDVDAAESIRIGIVGNFGKVKNHELFLEAAAIVVKQLPRARFVIIGRDLGKGDRECALRKYAGQLGILDRCDFVGWQHDIWAALEQLDVVVSTSREETFGRAIAEAMMAGQAVVATSVGAVAEVLGDAGILVESQSASAIADAVVRLCTDACLRRRISARAKERAREMFSMDKHAKRLLSVYTRVLAGESRASASRS